MLKWIMLMIYLLLCGYVLGHLLCAVSLLDHEHRRKAAVWIILFLVLAVSVFPGRFLHKSDAAAALVRFGNYWLGMLIYLVFFLFSADIFLLVRKLARHLLGIHQTGFYTEKEGYILAAVVVCASALLFIYGCEHQKKLTISEHDITIEKSAGTRKTLEMVLIADLHLGYSVGCDDMERMVEKINEEPTDIVILAGDIFDNDFDTLDDPQRLMEILGGIKSSLGVYAVYGNHDVRETLVGGFSISAAADAYRDPRMDEFMKGCGITVLEDERVLPDGTFCLLGRLDGEKNGYGTMQRKTLQELTTGVDTGLPFFVINHEPDELSEYAEYGVDVLLSGHTHAGQFFPLTLSQPFAWKNSWGVKKIGNMYSIVTSGVGLYGPPLRVGTDSEIVRVHVEFTGDESSGK